MFRKSAKFCWKGGCRNSHTSTSLHRLNFVLSQKGKASASKMEAKVPTHHGAKAAGLLGNTPDSRAQTRKLPLRTTDNIAPVLYINRPANPHTSFTSISFPLPHPIFPPLSRPTPSSSPTP